MRDNYGTDETARKAYFTLEKLRHLMKQRSIQVNSIKSDIICKIKPKYTEAKAEIEKQKEMLLNQINNLYLKSLHDLENHKKSAMSPIFNNIRELELQISSAEDAHEKLKNVLASSNHPDRSRQLQDAFRNVKQVLSTSSELDGIEIPDISKIQLNPFPVSKLQGFDVGIRRNDTTDSDKKIRGLADCTNLMENRKLRRNQKRQNCDVHGLKQEEVVKMEHMTCEYKNSIKHQKALAQELASANSIVAQNKIALNEAKERAHQNDIIISKLQFQVNELKIDLIRKKEESKRSEDKQKMLGTQLTYLEQLIRMHSENSEQVSNRLRKAKEQRVSHLKMVTNNLAREVSMMKKDECLSSDWADEMSLSEISECKSSIKLITPAKPKNPKPR